jgi:hypothetical protein
MRITKFFFTIILTLYLRSAIAQINKPIHQTTNWTFLTSIKYDAFCLINTLMGEEFYVNYYPKIFKHYDSLFTPSVRKSLNNLKEYKNKRGIILSAFLSNSFYQLPDSSLQIIVDNLRDKSKMRLILNTPNYSVYADIRNDLINVFEFLITNNFEKNYNRDIILQINKKISSLQPVAQKFNIVNTIEKTVGIPLSGDTVKFYLMRYSSPHGISINNNTFLSEVSYDFNNTMKVAIHEMMHPYFNEFPDDIKKAIKSLKKDSFIYNSFLNHDKNFGYNEFEAYIAEACVRALEQNISKQLGLGNGENEHWKTEDKGMHVFGAILIQEMKEKGFANSFDGNFFELLKQAIEDVKKQGGKNIYDKLFS